MHRRALAVVAASMLLLTACGGGEEAAAPEPAPEQPAEEPAAVGTEVLKIGVPLALTGPIAAQAEEMVNSFNLYVERNGGQLGGVPVELVFEDTEADPAVVVAKTRKLIEQDQVHVLVGAALAFESLAMIDVADENDIAFITTQSSADDLTQRDSRPIFARLNMTSSQPNLYLGEWAATEKGFKKVAIVAQDYAYGWESAGGFEFAFEQSGGEVVEKIWVPLDSTDITPFVRQIPSDVDAVYSILIGGFVPRFVQAYSDFGLKDTIPLLGGPDMIDEDALRAMGPEEVGLIGVHEYAASLDTAAEYVTAYQEKHDATPSYWGESTWVGAAWLDVTIAKLIADGLDPNEVPQWIRDNPEEFIAAVRAASIDAPKGPMSLDEYGNGIMDLYIFEVTAEDTKEILATFPASSQFWTVPADEFLAQPVFSRDFPG